MIILTIFRPDGSVYWVEYFNNMNACNEWLDEEKTRPYWSSEFTYSIEDKSPTQEQLQQQEAEILALQAEQKQLKDSAKARLKALGLTDAEVNAIIGS